MIELVELNLLLDELIEKLYAFLLSCGVVPKNKKLETLINSLDQIIAIKNKKTYYGIDFDENNVIKQISFIKGIVENKGELPSDILRGYYCYNNGKIILNENLRKKLWEE